MLIRDLNSSANLDVEYNSQIETACNHGLEVYMLKRNRVIISVLIMVLALLTACVKETKDKRPTVNGASVAKFEYAEEVDDGYKLITSEIASLYTFDSLSITISDDNGSFDWIYQITFNPKELVEQGNQIVVLFGEDVISINGQNYIPADGTDYSGVLDWATNKYQSFDYELQK